jgi:hypothetical protein
VKKSVFIVVLGLIVLTALSSAAQDKGYWPASSNTAKSITGDIAISDAKLVINFAGFPMVQARDLKPAEVSAVFDADINVGRTGFLYHLTVPGTKRFLHHNTLCGTEDTQWMATFVSGRTLQVAVLFRIGATRFYRRCNRQINQPLRHIFVFSLIDR